MTYDLVGNRTGLTATPLSGSTPCSGTPTANTYTLGACGSTGANTGNQRNWYNGDGLRVRARTFVSGRRDDDFVWDVGAGLPVVLQDTLTPQSGSPTTTTYLYGLGLVLETVGSNSYFYLSDGLGSTTELTDTSATVQNAYQYDVWGSLRATSGSTANQFEFAGQQTDHNANRGLQYLRARYYDPSLGRFITRDPIDGTQPYSYGANNPCKYVDPSGLNAESAGDWTVSCHGSAQVQGFKHAFINDYCLRPGAALRNPGLCLAVGAINDTLFRLEVDVTFSRENGAVTSAASYSTYAHSQGLYGWNRTGYTIWGGGTVIHANATFATIGGYSVAGHSYREFVFPSTGVAQLDISVDDTGIVTGHGIAAGHTWQIGQKAFYGSWSVDCSPR